MTLKAEDGNFSVNGSYFYVLAKKDSDHKRVFSPIMRSEVISFKESDDCWRTVSVPISSLVSANNVNVDVNAVEFQLQLYRHSRNGSHKLLATFESTVLNMLEKVDMICFRGSDEEEYFVHKLRASLITIPSFLDYINAGLNMNLIIGVDFTASNEDPELVSSLHYIGEKKSNQYLSAIYEVGKILLNFDTDKEVPLFGFGAIWPQQKEVSHCFAMNGNFFRPEVTGIEGITD